MKKKVIPLKKIKIYEQERSSTCGPAALRTFLSYFKIFKTEKQLVRLCKTTKAEGTGPNKMIEALEQLSFKTHHGSWASGKKCWKILDHYINKMKLPVIVDWFSTFGHGWDGHYSVVLKLTRDRITLADPEFHSKKERMHDISWRNFLTAWFDFNGDYVKRSDLFARWWLTGYPAPLSKKDKNK